MNPGSQASELEFPCWMLVEPLQGMGSCLFLPCEVCRGGVRQPSKAKGGLLFELHKFIISVPHCFKVGQNQLDKATP